MKLFIFLYWTMPSSPSHFVGSLASRSIDWAGSVLIFNGKIVMTNAYAMLKLAAAVIDD